MVLITNPQITESVNVQKMPVQREKTTLPEREVPVKVVSGGCCSAKYLSE